jgi:HK97 family phage major capsid protein
LGSRLGATDLIFAAVLKSLAGPGEAAELAARNPRASDRVRALLTKAAVAPATTSDATWAGALVGDERAASIAFVESLRSMSAFEFALPRMRQLPVRTRIVSTASAVVGTVVAQGAWKPASALNLAPTTLDELKAAALVIVSKEALEAAAAGGIGFIQNELRRAVAEAVDARFVEILGDAAPTPIASSGDDAASIRADIISLLAAVDLGAGSFPVLVVPPRLAKQLGGFGAEGWSVHPVDGGELANLPTRVSSAVADDEVVLFDAAAIGANSGAARIREAAHASVQMDDSPGSGAASLVSLWQTGCVAFMAERLFAATVIGSAAVAVLTDANWGAPGS